MKAYRLNEYEYWAGDSLADAIDGAMRETGCDYDDVVDDMFCTAANGQEVITDEDGSTATIAEILASMTARGLVCAIEP